MGKIFRLFPTKNESYMVKSIRAFNLFYYSYEVKVGKIEEIDKVEYSGTDTGIFGMLDTPSQLERLCIHMFKTYWNTQIRNLFYLVFCGKGRRGRMSETV